MVVSSSHNMRPLRRRQHDQDERGAVGYQRPAHRGFGSVGKAMTEEEPIEITLPIGLGIALWLVVRHRRRRAA
jgi:hypothetical protein